MSDIQQMRTEIMRESELVGSRRRFGLFSQPLPTALGDDGAFKVKIHPRDEMGKPLTGPRNIYVSPTKSGQLKKSYFGALNSLATHSQHDIFIQEEIRLLKQKTQSFNVGRKQVSFFPPNGTIKSLSSGAYAYIEQKNPQLDPKRFRLEDGRVRTGHRNFYTNNGKKVIDTLFKPYKYLDDPFQRKHEQQLERAKHQKSKEREQVFKPNSFIPALLSKDAKIYGSDVQLPSV